MSNRCPHGKCPYPDDTCFGGCCDALATIVKRRSAYHALEWDEQRDALVRSLTSMIMSWDQNGHLFMHRDDISQLVHAVELLKRCQLKK